MKTMTRRLTLTLALSRRAGGLGRSAGGRRGQGPDRVRLVRLRGSRFPPEYVEKNGDLPTFTFFGDEDEAFEKVRSGFKADLGHPCSQSVVKWREAGLLQPLDTSKIQAGKTSIPASWR